MLGASTVSGRVTGNNDEPLAFANVYVKGTSTGTTTNLDGYDKLELTDLPSENGVPLSGLQIAD